MYNTFTQMPSVPWSTVPGPRSIGYHHDDEEEAFKCHASIVRQLQAFNMVGCVVITTFIEEEFHRTEIRRQ